MEVQENKEQVTLCETRQFLVIDYDVSLLDENVAEGL